jgi:hypothetical protein
VPIVPLGLPRQEQFTEIVTPAGTAVRELRTNNNTVMWRIGQISTELPSAPATATCELRLNGALVTTLAPTGDAAVEPPPLMLTPSDIVTIEWAGATPGDVASVLVFYDRIDYAQATGGP